MLLFFGLVRQMQEEGSELDIAVGVKDQRLISEFSRLNWYLREREGQLEVLEKELLGIEDAGMEIYLTDETKYSLGDAFVALEVDECEELLENETTRIKSEIQKYEGELVPLRERVKVIKGILYSKFGKSINLEDGMGKSGGDVKK